jgi:hypothetical protein
MSEGIEYGAESDFHAPVMRIDDEGHGFHGVIYQANTRQATDFKTGDPKWFRDRKLVIDANKREGDSPVPEYVFHIAVKRGRGAFTTRDNEGNTIKDAEGYAVLEVRDVVDEDIAVVFGSAWMARAAKSVKLNTGHEVKFKRTAPARDSRGDRTTKVTYDIEVVGNVANPAPYKQPAAVGGADYGEPAEAPF